MRTTSAVSIATSVPAPMAIPRSAWARAGASFTPSPTIATFFPALCSSAILLALSPGSTSAITACTPSWAAIRFAVASLSPVSMTTSTPASFNAATAAAEVGRGASAIPINATASPSTATQTTVRPVEARSSRRVFIEPRSTPSRSIRRTFPTATRWPSTRAIAPCPGTFSNFSARTFGIPFESACFTTASARGCSDSRSTAATKRRTPSSVMPSTTTSVTSGSPLVSVPVLSRTTAWMRAEVSRAIAFLNRIPRFAPRPVPTMIAVGVARPSASGQVITTTVIAYSIAVAKDSPTASQTTSVAVPPIRATSTNQNAARSARRWPGALEFWASWTSFTICAKAVSAPTLVARTRSVPFLLIVAPITSDPGTFDTGRLSPVTTDSSTSLWPSSTTPSTPILSPGRTSIRSPTRTSAVGISTV